MCRGKLNFTTLRTITIANENTLSKSTISLRQHSLTLIGVVMAWNLTMCDRSIIVVLSGKLACGKTSVAELLVEKHEFYRVRTGAFPTRVANDRGLCTDRRALQVLGDEFDVETLGNWVVELALEQMSISPEVRYWLLDCVRRDFQIDRFRERYGDCVLHIHLTAPPDILKERYERRRADDPRDAVVSYELAKQNATELHAGRLGGIADLQIDTNTISPGDSAEKIATAVRFPEAH